MVRGIKKQVNIFRLNNLGEPKGVFNWRLWFATFSFGLLGAARGIDEGLISGAFNSKTFQEAIHYDSYSEVGKAISPPMSPPWFSSVVSLVSYC
jgi:hypothetical protein